MNTGQMVLGIAALGLLSFIFLNSNKTTTATLDSMITNKGIVAANSLALSLLSEIGNKAYDENTIGTTIVSASDFSPILQAESGEVYPNFDDVDDYNNFSKVDSIPQIGKFNLHVKVEYITDNLIKTSARTYNKNVIIVVKSPLLENQTTGRKDSLIVAGIFSQWKML